jgi:hypothetical protein
MHVQNVISRAGVQQTASRMKMAAEECRIELAKRLNKWEHVKQHFFLSSFMQVAHAHNHFFQAGCSIMADLAAFVEDIRGRVLTCQAMEVRQ